MRKSTIVLDSARSKDDNGYLHVSMTNISKACVNPYLGSELPDGDLEPDAVYYGLRDPTELARAASTFNGLPVLLDHHRIDAENQDKEVIVGSTGTDARFEAPYLRNSLTITDAAAIAAIEDGSAREISCAYRFTADWTPGEWKEEDGEMVHYDFVMRDISGNHVALVAEGRAGKDVRVADSALKGGKTMAKKRKMLADANLGIEASEVTAAGFLKAVNVIEAQVEGYDPRKVGLDIDKDATIDEIIDKFMPGLGDEEKNAFRARLQKLKAEPVGAAADEECVKDEETVMTLTLTEEVEPEEAPSEAPDVETVVDEDATVEDDDPAPDPAQDDDNELDELLKDPKCKQAFEAGVLYGEKREKKDLGRIDRDHERTGEERFLGEDTIARIASQTRARVYAKMRALNGAARKVEPLVGKIADPMAFDSAASIYAFALRANGIQTAKYKPAAYVGMVDMMLAQRRPVYAMDSAPTDKEVTSIMARLSAIR